MMDKSAFDRNRWTVRTGLAPVIAALVLLAQALAVQAAEYDRFVGEYAGEAISANGDELSNRDMSVSIKKIDRGFTVGWVSVIRKSSGKVKRTEMSIDFLPSGREGIFRSAMRKNLFGQAVPLDPMKGDPYVWAKIDADTLTIHAIHITEDGGYEMQTYNRTLTSTGMDLSYSRVRDGEILRTVTGILRRQ